MSGLTVTPIEMTAIPPATTARHAIRQRRAMRFSSGIRTSQSSCVIAALMGGRFLCDGVGRGITPPAYLSAGQHEESATTVPLERIAETQDYTRGALA